jgi:NitT/TauT family transport system substrate-binding protein
MSIHMARRVLPAAAACAALAIAGCGGDDESSGGGGSGGGGAAKTEIVYTLPTPESLLFFPPIVAEELGFFDEENVKAKLASAAEEIPSTAFLENGDADVAMADIDELVISADKGGEQKAIFSPQHSNTAGTVVPEDSDIQDFAGMKGKNVGLASEEDASSIEAQLKAAGLTKDDVETIVVGTSGPLIKNTFEQGKIDAYAGAASDFTAMRATGLALRNVTPPDVQRIDGNPTAVMPDNLEKKRDAIVGFLRGWAMGQHVGLTKPDIVEKIVRERVPAEWRNEVVGKAALEQAIELFKPDDMNRIGDVRPEVWETGQDLLHSVGIIEKKVDVSTIIDQSLIEEINDFDRAAVEKAADDWMAENGG